MQAFRVAVLASLALLCVPAALALGTGGLDAGGVSPGGVADRLPVGAVQAPQPSLPSVPLPQVPQAPVQGGLHAGADAHASAGDGGVQVQAGDGAAPAPKLEPSSTAVFVQQAAHVAGEAATAGALTVAVAAYSSGLDSLRALLPRPTGRGLGRLLRFLPFAALFSRIDEDTVLDNPVRAHVHQVVVQDPGLSLEEVRSRAGIAWGTAVHHLRRLEDTGLLVSIVQNARRRYFAANTLASKHRAQLAALTHPTARRLAGLVRERPGLDQTGLCQELGLRNPAASKHLQQLAAHGLLLTQRDGRRVRYHPTDVLHATFGILEGTPTVPAVPVTATPAPVAAVPA